MQQPAQEQPQVRMEVAVQRACCFRDGELICPTGNAARAEVGLWIEGYSDLESSTHSDAALIEYHNEDTPGTYQPAVNIQGPCLVSVQVVSTAQIKETPLDDENEPEHDFTAVDGKVMDMEVLNMESEAMEVEVYRGSSMPLSFVDMELAGQGMIEGILDSRSQVVALRKDIAEVLQLPIKKDGCITMEMVNRVKEMMEGVINNCPITFAGVTVCLPVQVIRNASFDIILGWPFTCALHVTTQDLPSGTQSVKITEPGSGKCIVMTLRQ
ncbi:hypothetical protein EV401DRAFT_2075572 [Pisolithus croceorrhizus]|nr:hypothetical protein EV401DRAFT_2075572 [Pisolithus croceorrhizus]